MRVDFTNGYEMGKHAARLHFDKGGPYLTPEDLNNQHTESFKRGYVEFLHTNGFEVTKLAEVSNV